MGFPVRGGGKRIMNGKGSSAPRGNEKKNPKQTKITFLTLSGDHKDHTCGLKNLNNSFLCTTFRILILNSYLNNWFMHVRGPMI